jgi:hypothetical protein
MQLLPLEPAVTKYVPAAHATQAGDPGAVWYCPTGQLRHAFIELDPVEAKNVPAAQIRHTVAPADAWYCPAKQSTHADTPLLAANLPAPQSAHEFEADPVDTK